MKPEHDSSLQAATLRRAAGEQPPKTLTPYEWLEWYDQHGQPAHHRPLGERPQSWWRRLLSKTRDT